MAGKIKGITIEFSGDTRKLDRALKDVQKETRSIDKDLKAVNKSLKFNPKNTELLAQKQTLLRDRITATKKQLQEFQDIQKQLDDKGVDKQSAEYMQVRREIIQTESKLKHFNAELEKTRRVKFDQLGKAFQDVGAKMQSVGRGMTKYVTAPIIAVGAAAVKSFNEVQDGLNIVAKKTGATGKQLEAMQTSARNLAKSLPTDFETAGTAIGEVNTRFGVTGDTLENLAGQFVKFAKINNTDVNTSIDLTQKALSAFGKSAKSAPALLDAMTRAAQKTGVSVETLQNGLIQNGTALQQLGLDIDKSTMFMAQLEKSGANSETVMQGLRKALKNATKDGTPLNKALSDLQNTIKNGTDATDGLTAAYDLFGKSGDQIYGAIQNGTLDFEALANAATDTAGALDKVFEETLTPAERFQMTMNTMKDTGYQLGANLMDMLAPALQKLAEWSQRLNAWWSQLDDDTKDMITKVGLVVAAIGPLLVVLGKVSSGIGALIKLFPLLASPVGIAVAAFGGLVAAGVAIYKNWDVIKARAAAFRDRIVEIFNEIKDFLAGIMEKIKSFFDFDFNLPGVNFGGGGGGNQFGWYASGGIVTRPTIAGVGEAGPEAIIPLDRLNSIIANAADSIVNGVNTGAGFRQSGDTVIPVYLYPSGPKMGEYTVKSYDMYKRQFG